jgi:hypothetical protein
VETVVLAAEVVVAVTAAAEVAVRAVATEVEAHPIGAEDLPLEVAEVDPEEAVDQEVEAHLVEVEDLPPALTEMHGLRTIGNSIAS